MGNRERWAMALMLVLVAGCECDLFRGPRPPADGGRLGYAGVGDPCADVSVCRAGLACVESACAPSGLGAPGSVCSLSGDCGEGLYCGPSRTCTAAGTLAEGDDCVGTADCTPGLLCRIEGFGGRCRAAGALDLGDPCTDESDCLAGLSCLENAAAGVRTCASAPPIVLDGGAVPPMLPFWPGVTCTDETGPPTAFFRVPRGTAEDGDFHRLPFPNDVRRTATGLALDGHPTPGSALAIDVLGQTIDAAEEDLDGFATNPVIYFRFSRAYDGGSVAGRARWVDITPGSPEYGIDRGLGWLTTYGPISRYICNDWVAFRSGHGSPLRPGTTYALILSEGITTAEGGEPFERAEDLDALLADTMPTDPTLRAAWDAYAPLRAFADDGRVDASTILNAAVFTTQTLEDLVPAMREVIRARPVPTIDDVTVCAEGVTSPCDDGTPQRRCGPPSAAYTEIHARVTLPIFQAGTAPYETAAEGGAILRDASGTPMVARDEGVCMLMTIPTGAPPVGGFPVVIAAHGTGGSFTGPIGEGLADTWATGAVSGTPVRAATIAFDLPQHGSRRGASTRSPDRLVFNFANPRAARDVWLQGAADLLALVRFAESTDIAAASSPTGERIHFDPTRITIWAHSQGTTHAALMLPWEPGVRAVLLSGVGGDLTESLLTKTEPIDIASVVPIALLDVDGGGNLAVGDYHPALSLIQMFYERVDPVNFGRRMYAEPIAGDTGRHLFMTYGIGDHFTTERTMRAFAASAALPVVAPELAPLGWGTVDAPLRGNVTVSGTMRTVGLRQYEPPPGIDGHFVSTRSPQGLADATRFLLEALAGDTPTIGE